MSIPKPSDWERWCENAHQSWEYLAKTGPEMIRLAKMPTTLSDGFTGGGAAEHVQAESELTPTERAANHRGFAGTEETPQQLTDWVLRHLGEAWRCAKEAKANATRAEVLFRMVESRADGRVGRQETSGGYCQACKRSVSGGIDDRIRSGYCEACFSAWRRWKDRWPHNPDMAVDRMAFERWRMRDLVTPDEQTA